MNRDLGGDEEGRPFTEEPPGGEEGVLGGTEPPRSPELRYWLDK